MNTSRPFIRVACVEDDPLFQALLKKVLVPQKGFDLVNVFNNAEQALATIMETRPDVVLLDLKLPGKTGIDFLHMVESHMPATAFVMLTGDDTPQQVFAALKAGACGYVLKTAPLDHLLEAVRTAAVGGSPLSPTISRVVISAFQTKLSAQPPRIPGITHRENELLSLFVKGLSAKEAAYEMGISYETVRDYLKTIYQKLKVRSRTEAVLKYVKNQQGPVLAF
ncbi:response regulator [Prosthecobacter vanneervenii]|uniref:DNA-binding NarL/FixJ family response regulator n=1 Tax=Prosthecobacter vanneervenii TaxID=48466 RepID=A0A7W7Y9Y8_9BACT|nr:response regulator transcription factor [Prosthecobacter vanneervenii]MBB5032229.1 DNA-binding NarL/FixJ family response regulator [Prosthecobacter vanneervenii]